MPKHRDPSHIPDHRQNRLVFLQRFLKRPQQVGSITPSSRFLERRVIRLAGVRKATTLVELGAGTGGITRALLGAMSPEARLLCVEIDPEFYRVVQRIDDPRLVPHLGSAADLDQILAARGFPPPEAVISGIPFSTMRRDLGLRILEGISEALAPGGRFVAYQVRDRVASLGRLYMGKARVEVELLNIPPVRVYSWEKDAA